MQCINTNTIYQYDTLPDECMIETLALETLSERLTTLEQFLRRSRL